MISHEKRKTRKRRWAPPETDNCSSCHQLTNSIKAAIDEATKEQLRQAVQKHKDKDKAGQGQHIIGYSTRYLASRKPIPIRVQGKRWVDLTVKDLVQNEEDWLVVLWSDEVTFTVMCNRGGNVYKGSDPFYPPYTRGTVKFVDSLMVWGSFSGRGLGKLIVLPLNMKVN